MRMDTEALAYEILSVVEEIPEGNVATYGQIARLIGREKNARLVGTILSRAEIMGHIPVTASSIIWEDAQPAFGDSAFCLKRRA